MATTLINLQNRFLNRVKDEFQRHDTQKAAYDQVHMWWKVLVNTLLEQINACSDVSILAHPIFIAHLIIIREFWYFRKTE